MEDYRDTGSSPYGSWFEQLLRNMGSPKQKTGIEAFMSSATPMVGAATGLIGLVGSLFTSQPQERQWKDFIDEGTLSRLEGYGQEFTDPTSWMNRTLLKQNQQMLADRGGVAARVMEMKQLMGGRYSPGIGFARQKQMDFDAASKAFSNWQQQLLKNQGLGVQATAEAAQLGMRARTLAEEFNQEEQNVQRSFFDSLTGGFGLMRGGG